MHTLSHPFDSAVRWLAAAALALLPFQSVAGKRLALFGGLLPFDALMLIAVGLGLPRLWASRRSWIGTPAGWMVLALSVPAALSELLQLQPEVLRRLAEQLAPLGAVLVVGWAAGEGPGGLVRRAAFWGGAAAIGVSLCGWLLDRITGLYWFSVPARHPVFDQLPRLFGTFAGSPERLGSFVVYWLALAAAAPVDGPRQRGLRAAALTAGAAVLLLSMSYAWVGGLVLAAARAPRRWRRLALVAALLAVLVASVPISRGPSSEEVVGPCRRLDVSHLLAIRVAPGQCRRLSHDGRALTAYQEAKRVSWSAFLEHPGAGVGYSGFVEFARRSFERRYGAAGIHYRQPHGVFHGLPAKHGMLGVLALLGGLYALKRGWRGSVWDWCVVALLAIGVHIDVDRLRESWAVLGFLLAERWFNAEGERRPRPEAFGSAGVAP